ncbi:NADPH-dependent oxidoreductase [Oceanobacillus sp. Castelsardo]|uniref:NADPH-dependent oxidoreductase n=1 Tax=Oceanobacillus sp. Castelsardo TaxID=1851204 RepID=UPI000838CC99|nr:NADPH-dependent oxidoreductase [Oceanobacillus sp. Castelsardo]
MNETINLLNNHRSIRKYTEENVKREHLDIIIKSAMAGPNWANGQQVTVIEIQDKAKKETLSELAGGQVWINDAPVIFVFCLDFHRLKIAAENQDRSFTLTNDSEYVLIGSTDVGIALGHAVTAAESLGLGTVPIGGIRKNPEEVIELLDLPKYVFPIAGLVVGHPANHSAQKPRLPLEAVHHMEKYNTELHDYIRTYDKTMSIYLEKRTSGADNSNWSHKILDFYERRLPLEYGRVKGVLQKQGFHLGKNKN